MAETETPEMTWQFRGAYYSTRTDMDGETKLTITIPQSDQVHVTNLSIYGRQAVLDFTVTRA